MTPFAEPLTRPHSDEYFHYYDRYISLAPVDGFFHAFKNQIGELRDLLSPLPEERTITVAPPYTWTLRQVVGHLIDVERIFSYRLLRLASGDSTPIPGYDQDVYVANRDYSEVLMSSLLEEFEHLRLANVLLVQRLSPEALMRRGTASGHPVSAKANLFILVGHVIHHLKIIQLRLAGESQ